VEEIEILDRIGALDRERSDLYTGAARGGLREHGLHRLHALEACIENEWERLRRCRAGTVDGRSGLRGGW
jgi:hypothetical protein